MRPRWQLLGEIIDQQSCAGNGLGDPANCRYHARVVVRECRQVNWRIIRIAPSEPGSSFWEADIIVGAPYVKGNFDTTPDVLFDNDMHIGFKARF
ncbi:uncharacterized protein METZ01_LOCUS498360 [marine metagenome]|uniref:Uncharacterized protein n=1 Tax=marine metagenome TaxID=408172 RepID=A0A383DLZ0_9ZZZZ